MEIDLSTIRRSLGLLRFDNELEILLRLCVSLRLGRRIIKTYNLPGNIIFSATNSVVHGPSIDVASHSDS